MAYWSKSRNNRNAKRLLKQVAESEFEHREYAAPRIRHRTHVDVLWAIGWWDLPNRGYGSNNRCWKRHRKSQYKNCGIIL